MEKQIIAFCHFKGGVGASFLASNVALELAKSKLLTCLVDFDTKYPNCANILGIEVKRKSSMQRFFSNKNPDIAGDFFIYDKNVSPYLYIVSSSNEDEVEILEDINDNQNDVENLLNITRETFDVVLVDLPIDYQNPQVFETIKRSDKVFVVGDMDINAIENTFRSLELLKSINIQLSKFSYIANKYFTNNDITTSTIQDTLGIRVAATVLYDYNTVYESISKSKPVVNGKHKIVYSIKEICNIITGNVPISKNIKKIEEKTKMGRGSAREEAAPTSFKLIYNEEGGKPNGNR